MQVKKEAVWAIANACMKASQFQAIRILEEKGLEAIVEMLHGEDADLLMVLLEAVDSLLKFDDAGEGEDSVADKLDAMGGVAKIEALQLHKNKNVYERVIKLLDKRILRPNTNNTQE